MKSKIDEERILEILKKVEQPYREVVIMRHVNGLKPAEIAAAIGESSNVVSVRINRGLKQLRSLLPDG